MNIPKGIKRLFGVQVEGLKLSGRYKLIARHIHTGEEIVIEGHNLIVDVGKEAIGDMFIDAGAQFDTGWTYCALGADNTAPAVGQTQLVDEGGGAAMRKTLTTKSRTDNEITLSTFFTAAQSTLAIEEGAIFGTSTAGAGENSGVMLSRWLVSFDNSGGLYDITIQYVLTIG